MKDALVRLFSSAKFWTMLIGLAVTLGARYGFQVDADVMWMIAGLVGILLGAQGLTDHGKSAAMVAGPATQVAQGDVVNVAAPAKETP